MTARTTTPSPWALLELPFALVSFVAYRLARAVFRKLAQVQMSKRPEVARSWRVISGPAVSRPLVLPLVMTTGPRWNTHAVIGTVGPIEVREKLSFDRAVIERSSASWTAVVNRYPAFQTVARLGGGEGLAQGPSEISLPPGKYNLNFRYYLLRGAPTFPAISADGQVAVQEASFPPDVNSFYEAFGARSRPLYKFLHYYVTTLLRLRGWVSESRIAGELLPIGNPETAFVYDAVSAGRRVRFELAPELLETHLVLLTMYGRDSFPFYSARIEGPNWESPPALRDGFFLLRLHSLVPVDDPNSALSSVRTTIL